MRAKTYDIVGEIPHSCQSYVRCDVRHRIRYRTFFGDIVYDVIFPHRYITMSYVDVVRHIYILRYRTYTPAETYEYTVRRRTVISYVILCCLPASAIEATLCSSGPCCHWQRPSPWPAVPMGPASCSSALLNSLY